MIKKADNEKVLDNGFAEGLRIIEDILYDSLVSAAERLFVRVSTNRQFIGFTGNTQTSYACGIYVKGILRDVLVQNNWSGKPLRMKVRKGEFVYMTHPYEGRSRGVTGKVDIVERYGLDLSVKQLKEYKAPKKGIALMMTTGTEYSVYIEQSMSLDVLTNTFKDAPRIIESNWKKIPD